MLTLMIAGSVAGSGSSILLLLWAVLCRDCATIKTVLLLLAGVFDLLAIVAIILFVLAMPVCGTGVLSAAVIVGGVAFQLLMPYLYQCGTGCMPTRILLGVLMALTGALLIAAVIVGLIGILGAPALLPVAVGLYIAGVIAMAVTLNVMVAFLLLCD
jgi:hypothetical protein